MIKWYLNLNAATTEKNTWYMKTGKIFGYASNANIQNY